MQICMVSLGCDKNLVDSESMLGLTIDMGYTLIDDESEADIIIVNTCCFILDAKEESIQALLEASEYKKSGKCKAIIATGCLAERYREEIIAEIPEVDAVIGTSTYDSIVEVISRVLNGEKVLKFEDLSRLPKINTNRSTSTGGWYAYLKIAEGCDKHCTYCIIPSLRGNFRSYPMEQLIDQSVKLAQDGVEELILVAQETTVYGTDIYGKKSLSDLLKKLCKIEGIKWIRLLYCYPEEINDELIDTISSEPKICNYLDIPIQSASDNILKRMGRRTSKADLLEVIGKLRKKIPDIALRTTLISGFPGETDEDHNETLEFIKQVRFERLGVFPYSAEEGTPAAEFKNQLTKKVKTSRRDDIMKLQQGISRELLDSMIGRELEAIIEGKLTDEDAFVGRTYMDTPGVDGYIFITGQREYMSGEFVKVKITGASEYDLMGEVI